MPLPLVSFIVPLHNACATVARALASIEAQTFRGPLEVCVYDDASRDGGADAVRAWYATAPRRSVLRLLSPSDVGACSDVPLGPAFARNRATAASSGAFLCMLDADDVAAPARVELQLAAAVAHPSALIGGGFVREPSDATPAYTAWANGLDARGLVLHAWREVTLVQPTWFMARDTFMRVGGYDEAPSRLWWARDSGGGGGGGGGGSGAGRPSHGAAAERQRLGGTGAGLTGGGAAATALGPAAAAGTLAVVAAAADGAGQCSACAVARGFAAPSMRVAVVPAALDALEAAAPSLDALERGYAPGGDAARALQTSVLPWPASEAPQRHGAILSRPPLKLLPRALARGSAWTYDPRTSFPEDTVFLHRHLSAAAAAAPGGGGGPALVRVPECVLVYTHSPSGVSWRVPRQLLMRVRSALWEERVQGARGGAWAAAFSIWGAGRDGKAFFGALSPAARACVAGWVDIDPRKTRAGALYPPPSRAPGASAPRPVRHALRIADDVPGSAAIAVCVALDKGGAELRGNVAAASAARVAAGGAPLVEGHNLLYMC